MNVALISLSNAGARIAAHLAAKLPACYAAGQQVLPSPPVGEGPGVRGGDEETPKFLSDDAYESARISCEVFLHTAADADAPPEAVRFERIAELTRELFPRFQGLVYIAPLGLVVRAVAPCLQHKTTDPGVVVVDVGARWAVSLVGGHEGGANRLAVAVANVLGAEAVVTTSTEAAKDLIVGVGCRRGTSAEAIVAAVRDALAAAACPLDRVRLLATAEVKADEAGLHEAARRLQVPLRWIADEEIRATRRVFESSPLVQEKVDLPAVAEPAALLAGRRTRLLLPKMIRNGVTVAIARGRLYAVGIGPGGPAHRTFRAVEAIRLSGVVVGYRRYLELIADLTAGKEVISSGMTQEVQRCRAALERAAAGQTVALVSSGDAGIYGMAGLAIELAAAEGLSVPIEVVPGVTAASAAAAALGAPLMLDFAAISLSDLLVPWEVIRRRLEAVAAADLVAAIYNPRSAKRVRQLAETVDIFRAVRPGSTPVGIATAAGQVEQSLVVTDLDHLLRETVDMTSIVIIGNSDTRLIGGRMVTARGYRV